MVKNKYTIPLEDRKEYNLMIQRANRRINANFKYIQQENIKTDNAVRSLVSDYADPTAWYTKKTVFSRRVTFDSKKDYEQYRRHVEQWGKSGRTYDKSRTEVKKGYYENIIKSLTTIAIDNSVLTEGGELPGDITKKIKKLSFEQMTNFFEHADPTEDIEVLRFSSSDYNTADPDDFVDITESRINALIAVFPVVKKPKTNKTTKRKKSK